MGSRLEGFPPKQPRKRSTQPPREGDAFGVESVRRPREALPRTWPSAFAPKSLLLYYDFSMNPSKSGEYFSSSSGNEHPIRSVKDEAPNSHGKWRNHEHGHSN